MAHMYNEILLSHKKEQNNAICRNMNESWDCHSEWSQTKRQISCDIDYMWNLKKKQGEVISHIWLFVTPWIVAYQVPHSVGFSRQEYWSGLLFPSPEYLPNPRIEPRSPTLQADTLLSEPPGMWNLRKGTIEPIYKI